MGGYLFNNKKVVAKSKIGWKKNEYIGVLLDMDTCTLTFLKNGNIILSYTNPAWKVYLKALHY